MANNQIPTELTALADSLDALASQVKDGSANDKYLADSGWNYPALNRFQLARMASDLAASIRERAPEAIDDETLSRVKEAPARIQKFRQVSLQHLFNGNSGTASSLYLVLLSSIRFDLEPLLGWQTVRDTNLLPPKLARRLRSYQSQLDAIAPDKDQLEKRIKLINDATEAAESLPTDLETLAAARSKIEKLGKEAEELSKAMSKVSEEAQGKATVSEQKLSASCQVAEGLVKHLEGSQKEADKLVAQCGDAYRITTTKGLAGAFAQRAIWLQVSMWIWVCVLVAALGIGYWLGADRIKSLAEAISKSEHSALIWFNGLLAVFSFGGPIWLAWIATKQIGQCFRLKEDYAFKASVAKAYEGYKKEAARIDPGLEARLFESALTRLEEAPIRLVEEKTHGSPWHEFLESTAFRDALKTIPGLRGEFTKLLGKKVKIPIADGEASNTAPK